MAEFLELICVNLSIEESVLNMLFLEINSTLKFCITDGKDGYLIGAGEISSKRICEISDFSSPVLKSFGPLKRTLEFQSTDSKKKAKFAISSKPASSFFQSKDVGSVLKKLNIFPGDSDELQCTLCPYKATRKSHLKTHYQLKHLGGGGLAVICSICQQKCATKSSCKKHMMSVHKLSNENASKLLN